MRRISPTVKKYSSREREMKRKDEFRFVLLKRLDIFPAMQVPLKRLKRRRLFPLIRSSVGPSRVVYWSEDVAVQL